MGGEPSAALADDRQEGGAQVRLARAGVERGGQEAGGQPAPRPAQAVQRFGHELRVLPGQHVRDEPRRARRAGRQPLRRGRLGGVGDRRRDPPRLPVHRPRAGHEQQPALGLAARQPGDQGVGRRGRLDRRALGARGAREGDLQERVHHPPSASRW